MRETLSRDEWLAERKNHIGASEVAAIIGADKRRGPLAVYEAKVTGFSMEDNEWLKYGRDIEAAIANMYAVKAEREVDDLGATYFQYHPNIPFLAATLDRVTLDREKPADSKLCFGKRTAWAPLELKSVDPFGAKISAKEFEKEPPLSYMVQLQIQMACTGAKWGSIAGLFPGYQLVWHDAERNDDFLNAVYPKLDEFWNRVQRRVPPPADELPGTLDVVKRLWAKESGATVVIDPEMIPVVDEWEHHKSIRSESDKRAKALETRLRAAMGEATFGNLGDGTLLSLKTTKRGGYTVKPSEFRTLRRSRVK